MPNCTSIIDEENFDKFERSGANNGTKPHMKLQIYYIILYSEFLDENGQDFFDTQYEYQTLFYSGDRQLQGPPLPPLQPPGNVPFWFTQYTWGR